MRQLIAAGAAGNVTVPHKAAVHALCARHTPLAERTGAVNTFWVEDGALVGDNTDVAGFLALLAVIHPFLARDEPVAVVGAGGAAAAVLAALESRGAADVRIANRSRARAEALCARFADRARVADSVEDAVRGSRLVVNATTIGLRDDAFPVPLEALEAEARVLDLVYRRGETPWKVW